MSKTKTTFFCQNCGAQAPKWIGRCPSCGEWNTYVEEVLQKDTGKNRSPIKSDSKAAVPHLISEIEAGKEKQDKYTEWRTQQGFGGWIGNWFPRFIRW